ncbi:phosphate/phosphite/phosphonate ABC transporter substrate-binding protein [Kiloniella sp. EL199]|uniref:phosphate/phosphite/phosphonate ABC transporter substrate-binding protein n=1 Tax=Kiloniella sp. EL199 TaxID=2107581 RepID=UPI0013C4DA0D|nr:phosphate/phosphite/phosphonate ABC transporter substrate-binding protein [Kiloniella sp. EL199]
MINLWMQTYCRFTFVLLAMFFGLTHTVQSDTLTIGTISSEPVGDIKTFAPFANFLAEKLIDDGVDEVQVVIAPDIKQMVGMLKQQEIDLFIDSSITASIINKLSGSQFMLRRWKKGRAKYRSVIFVAESSDIQQISDLRGKIIAFEEPFSTSGYVLPALAILQSQNQLHQLERLSSFPVAEEIGFIMAYDSETQMVWLERDLVAAAAMSEDDYLEYVQSVLIPMRVLHTTAYVPYHVVVHRSGLEENLIKRIRQVLKTAHEDKEGAEVLNRFERTTKFDEIPDDLLQEIKRLEPFLGDVSINQSAGQ